VRPRFPILGGRLLKDIEKVLEEYNELFPILGGRLLKGTILGVEVAMNRSFQSLEGGY